MVEENKFKLIEEKWQKYWAADAKAMAAKNDSDRPKKYILVEFPYPSGSGLHVGHMFTYIGADVYARFWRMKGFNVLFPMGWDAFGLPTENYAIKMKRKPQEVTKENSENFKRAMKLVECSFDWSREVNTTDPNYYKWTQWIFIQLFKKGLAYKQEMPINWCPSCKIGLANEEVLPAGRQGLAGKCERCGAEVERRTISQWVVKITDYADRLIDGLKSTDFIEKVKMAQVNWIGKSEGARINFQLSITNYQLKTKTLEVFTTRADTLFGVTFMVISPEHPFVDEIINDEIKEYRKSIRSKSDMERAELNKEKTGVFSGVYVINPVNGKEIPLWVADYVLMGYGTGVVMGVPAHDERDNAFAKKYGLPIIEVIDENGLAKNSEMINGLNKDEAIKKMNQWVEEKGAGKATTAFHLRDWIFSRQHYWGEPIPMINCTEHGWVPVPEDQLPIELPKVEAYEPTDDGKSPLSKIDEFVNTVCPVCGKPAKRETDTMPNWAGSDWYFMRYCDPHNDTALASQELLKKWMPVDVYIGGDEHNTLHLLYSRFIYQFLWDMGVVPKEIPEPYFKRISHGVILGPNGARMSKSHGNVVLLNDAVEKYGVDVLRTALMFMGPFDGVMAWNEKTVMGVKRFLERYEKFINSSITNYQLKNTTESSREVKVIINKTIEGVTRDIEEFGYNTAIAKLMEALNKLSITNYELRIEDIKTLIKLIAPMAPYMAEELWSFDKLRTKDDVQSVHIAQWPVADPKYLVEETVTIAVAVNGKVRDQLSINNYQLRIKKEEILKQAKELEKIKKWLEGKEIVKEIYISGRMINIVVK